MLTELTIEERLRLIRFMCSFAWADLDVAERERNLVREFIRRFDLPATAVAEAEQWLIHPPSEEDLDPYDIPPEHRRLVLDLATEIVGVDGVVDRMEVENLALFQVLMGIDDDDDEGDPG